MSKTVSYYSKIGVEQAERLARLNQIAISKMRILLDNMVTGRLGNE